ncbi:uncharacterized protein SPAPADRAFT_61723 [Spathaspora passalidarum NRRL Y-27907]|uniref:BSD domain-containing protein n=1 Tax=Spathaspora passalidarum (strain NRRL Y-27907 / 11-Y1) TaxID=619300 RepID=G3AP90_SPAPN|nr:uncharacterized protein SPAPADRAFT_61723 [Spathaspora passalidarum NRRL Y-27907]EGW32661.1 hypothetical protein SPAPADRAFT_61723 [Spathaspora passalidarum NRRL Y-27907]
MYTFDALVPEEPSQEESNEHVESKTEEAIEKLQEDIDKVYNSIQDKFQGLWSTTAKSAGEIQEKYKLDEYKQNLINQLNTTRESIKGSTPSAAISENLKSIEEQVKNIKLDGVKQELDVLSTQANHALDALDSQLEKVENVAGKYLSSFASYFTKNVISITPETTPQPEPAKEEVLFSSPLTNNYGTSRYDNDLFKLHTSKQYFLSNELDKAAEIEKFKADEKTKVISDLLEKYPNTLTKTMNELVPVEISYNLFWYRYFKNEDKLKDLEQKRKALLKEEEVELSEDKDEEEDEEFTWDDDEDFEEADDKLKESPVKVEPEDTKITTPTKPAQKTESNPAAKSEPEDADSEEEDDDWE